MCNFKLDTVLSHCKNSNNRANSYNYKTYSQIELNDYLQWIIIVAFCYILLIQNETLLPAKSNTQGNSP